jgi:hypothetical protein
MPKSIDFVSEEGGPPGDEIDEGRIKKPQLSHARSVADMGSEDAKFSDDDLNKEIMISGISASRFEKSVES